jgi:chorismate mutase
MDLSDWRARIDTVDQLLVDLLNRRMRYALAIGEIKRDQGQPIFDPKREKEVIDALTEYNDGPISAAAIEEIFARVMKEARQLEER